VCRRVDGKTPTDLQLAHAECRVFIAEQVGYKWWLRIAEGDIVFKDEFDVESV
jgi:hypothetical protein